ncbi:hypothetical protein AX15_003583 [Amanita polypyramis BW_CC]|nr:hypothetical protein AX15_003583 [Amanita polypyramis BW_CC]
MEGLCQRSKSHGKYLETDETLRLQKRPNKTNTFEDFGSSFSQRSNDARRDLKKATSSIYKYGESHPEPVSRSPPQELADLSDDELDFLSQTSHRTDDEATPRKSSQAQENGDYMCRLNGTIKPTHEAIKSIKFSKTKRNNNPGVITQRGSASPIASPSKHQKRLNPHDNKVGSSNMHRTSSQTIFGPEHARARGSTYSSSGSQAENIFSNRPKPHSKYQGIKRQELALEEISVNSQASKPKSRTVGKVGAVGSEADYDTLSQPDVKPGRRPAIDMSLTRRSTLVRMKHIDEDKVTYNTRSSRDRAKERSTSHSTSNAPTSMPTIKKPMIDYITFQPSAVARTPKAFPIPSSPSSQKQVDVLRSPSAPDLGARQRVESRSPTLRLREFPIHLPTRGESPTPRPREFPMSLPTKDSGRTPPLGASDDRGQRAKLPKPRLKGKSKKANRASECEDGGLNEEVEESSRPVPQPFPMTQMLSSICATDLGVPSVLRKGTPEVISPKPQKEKHKNNFEVQSSSKKNGYDWDEDLSMSLSVDPKLLCPFCDALLPAPPTPHLKKLIDNALKKSRPDPRPGNPMGRKAPSAVFITICQRHQFESEELPMAEANGWPKSIDWDRLSNRVWVMQDDLEGLVASLRIGAGSSFFWDDVKQELQAKGSRAVASVRGQFANFEKAQPGYYGELGYAIIHQTLLDLFPPTSCNLDFTVPLTPEHFVQRVLVPEVAARLIQEDMDLYGDSGLSKALQVLRDSSKYGVAMFPDDSADNGKGDFADPDQLGVVDLIVMERARKRRKELEEEDLREKEKEEREIVTNEKKGRKKKSTSKGKEKAGRGSTEEEHAPRLKPRPKAKSRSTSQGTPSSQEPQASEDPMGHYPLFPESSQDKTEVGQALRPRPRPKSRLRRTNQENHLLHEPTSHDETSGDLMDYRPESSQTSMIFPRWKGYVQSCSEYETTETEEEVLVPDSDLGEGSGFPPAPTRNLQLSTNMQSHDFAELTSSSEDIEVSSPVRQRRKKRRERESENEATPKPAKVGRTGLLGSSVNNSHPLLLARRRVRQHKGTEPAVCEIQTDDPWSNTMLSPSASASDPTSHRSDLDSFCWLLSDCSQETDTACATTYAL